MSKNFSSRRSFLDLLGRRALCRLSGLLVLCWFMVAAQALYAQNPVISLTLKNVTVHEVIEAVKKESGYSFWYRESEIDLSRRVSVEAQGQNVLAPNSKAVTLCFTNLLLPIRTRSIN